MSQTPMNEWPTWLQQIFEAGYLAAMTKQPFNPFAMTEWQQGFMLYTETHVAKPIRRLIPGP